eukprot:6172974-Pleurochrysis_carterae.AAC.1
MATSLPPLLSGSCVARASHRVRANAPFARRRSGGAASRGLCAYDDTDAGVSVRVCACPCVSARANRVEPPCRP